MPAHELEERIEATTRGKSGYKARTIKGGGRRRGKEDCRASALPERGNYCSANQVGRGELAGRTGYKPAAQRQESKSFLPGTQS